MTKGGRYWTRGGIGKPMSGDLERFIEDRTIPEPNSGCLLWVGSRRGAGYGVIHLPNGTGLLAVHRFVWQREFGTIPAGKFVCHKCDTPCCVNLNHLFLGTAADNVNDMMRKGRQKLIGTPPKLKPRQVVEIRRLIADGHASSKIASAFGVCRGNINSIKRGATWGWLK